ncbi:MAG: hypothetical protein BA867_09660 [Desulfobacterales bacterium S5133MH16]|nr:MAG: hypothetical protein BA867_09660 [Desulfobacterales bacterium S5133MH16]
MIRHYIPKVYTTIRSSNRKKRSGFRILVIPIRTKFDSQEFFYQMAKIVKVFRCFLCFFLISIFHGITHCKNRVEVEKNRPVKILACETIEFAYTDCFVLVPREELKRG